MNKYKIANIEPKNGKLKDVHKRWLGEECEIDRLEIGHAMTLTSTTTKIGPFPNQLFTSGVSNVEIDKNGDITVFTQNTTYYLQFVE